MPAQDKLGQPILYLVRHGTVNNDTKGLIRGTQNTPLNDQGKREADEVADFFADIPISGVYSDDLDRTYHTAIRIAHAKDLEVVQDIALRSWDVGADLEGRSIDANAAEIAELKLQPDTVPVGGQSWRSFETKMIAAFNRYVAKALSKPNPLVLVLHGSNFQVIWDCIGEQEKSPDYDATPLEPSGIAAIYATRNGYSARIMRLSKEMADA